MVVVVAIVANILAVVARVEVVVASVDMSWLDIPMVVVTIPNSWKVWCMNSLRIYRGCVVGRGSLHRRGRSRRGSCNNGEKESKDLHGWENRL